MGRKQKVLIIRPSALGDMLMLSPALAQLRLNTEVTLVGKRPGLDFLGPYVDSHLDYEGPGWHYLYMERVDSETPLPLPLVDHIVAFLSDSDGRVKHNLKTRLPETSIHIFPPFPPKNEKTHVSLYLAQCLQRSGLPLDAAKSMEEAWRHPIFMNRSKMDREGKIIFHPGSGGTKKNHPPDFWLELIKRAPNLLHFTNKNAILLLGPAEEPLSSLFREKLDGERYKILISPDCETLTSLLSESPLYLGQDSGITHLAAMHGTPTIALFKNTSIYQWRPIGPAVKVIEDKGNIQDLLGSALKESEKMFLGYQRVNIPG